ncbi:hypothetical protein ACWPKS_08595 [Coraliomargarita sp. W4R72]
MKQIALLLLVSVTLCGCVTVNKSSQSFDSSGTSAAVRIHSNYKGIPPLTDLELWFRSTEKPELGKIFFKESGQLLFIPLEPGKYDLIKIDVGNYYLDLENGSHFYVKEEGITYIGDLYIEMKLKLFSIDNEGVKIEDEFEKASAEILSHNPSISISKSLIELK